VRSVRALHTYALCKNVGYNFAGILDLGFLLSSMEVCAVVPVCQIHCCSSEESMNLNFPVLLGSTCFRGKI